MSSYPAEACQAMKVNCPKCDRAYKVDDHRIPADGLKMRCPQCSQSFRVSKAGVKKSLPPPEDDASARPSIRPRRPVRPSRGAPQPPKPLTSAKGATAGIGDELDLPSIGGDDDFGDIQLPPLDDDGTLGVPDSENQAAATSDESFGEMTLPSPGDSAELAGEVKQDPFGDIGLSAPPTPPTAPDSPSPKDDDPFGEIDLPVPMAAPPPAKPAKPARPAKPAKPAKPPSRLSSEDDPFSDIDLPAPTDAVDLPSPSTGIDLPGPSQAADLPSPVGAVDLLSPSAAVDLPTPSAAVDLPGPAGTIQFGSSHVPSPAGAVGMATQQDAGAPPSPGATVQLGSPVGIDDIPSPADALGAPPVAGKDDPFGDINLSTAPDGSDGAAREDDFSDVSFADPGDSAGVPETAALPPLGSTISGDFPQLDGDSEANMPDLASLPPETAPPAGAPAMTRVHGSGTTNFGEVDLGPAPVEGSSADLPVLDDDAAEFDAFPTRRETSTGSYDESGDSPLELDSSPLDFDGSGMLVDEPVAQAADDSERRPAVSFSGRRKFERQSRRTKIMLLALLVLLLLGGAGLTFTPLGPYGAYALYKLLPSAGSAKVVEHTHKSLTRWLKTDTERSLEAALKDLDESLRQFPDNENLLLLGVYANYWHQIRFGIDKKYDQAATKMLGSINLSESESPYAPLARVAQILRTGKTEKMVALLQGPAATTPNGLSLLVTGYLISGANNKALATAKKLEAKEKSARAGFLLARALLNTGARDEAIKKLETLVEKYPKHLDATLKLTDALLHTKKIQKKKIRELAGRVIENKDKASTKKQIAQAHALSGYLLLIERNPPEASIAFTSAEKLDPNNILTQIGKGEIALVNGDLSTAATSFNKALAEEPDSLFARLGSIETTLAEGELGEAKDSLLELLPQNPRSARVHYLLGKAQWALKKLEEAEKEFKTAIELDGEYLNAYISLSQFYLKQRKDKEAMIVLDDASEAVPGSPLINQTLAEAQAMRGDFAAAIVELSKALDLDPDDVRTHYRMAQMYRKLGSLEDATLSLKEVEKRAPNFSGLALEQGMLTEISGNVEKALAAYKRALSESPNDIQLKIRVATASHLLGDDETAERLLSEAIVIEPKSAEINFYLGEVFRVSGRAAEALVLLKKAAAYDSENALYHLRYGMTLRDVRDVAQAMEEYKIARRLDPKLAEIYVRIGELQLTQGSARDAIASVDKGLALDSTIADAYEIVAEALEQLGELRAAVNYYRRAVKAIPDNAALFFKLGLAELGVYGNRTALPALNKSIELCEQLDPEPEWLPEALYRLGAAQEAVGKRAAAVSTFKRYLEIAPENHIDRSEVLAHLDRLTS